MKVLLSLELALFAIAVINALTDGAIAKFGIHPRQFSGLFSIFTHVFLHQTFGLFFINAMAFASAGAHVLLQPNGLEMFGFLSIVNIVAGGLFVWAFGSVGVVYEGLAGCIASYLFYMLLFGVITKELRDIVISTISIMVWLMFISVFFGTLYSKSVDQPLLFGVLLGVIIGFFDGRNFATSGNRLFGNDYETDKMKASKAEISTLTAHTDDQLDDV